MNSSKRDETHHQHQLKQSLKQHAETKTARKKQSRSLMMAL